MTFTLDETTVAVLKRIATRLQKPQSHVIREAICHYEPHAGRLSKAERKRRVNWFDRVIAAVPSLSIGDAHSLAGGRWGDLRGARHRSQPGRNIRLDAQHRSQALCGGPRRLARATTRCGPGVHACH